MANIGCFSADYAEAREKFLGAARISGAAVTTFTNPTRGPKGETLATDVAWLGPADARKVVVTISATHGVEGFCGSGAQIDWLVRSAAALPPDIAALSVHAINPYSFAWLRRVTEEGNDLNRNYVDHAKPYPDNPGYDDIADLIIPRELDGPVAREAAEKLTAYRHRVGMQAFNVALSGGQFRHAHGLFFGGGGPSWANRTTHAIIDAFLRNRSDIAVIDFHTGLGPFGYGELITHYEPDSDGSARVRAFWGDSVTESKKGQTSSAARDGLGHYAFNRALPDARVTMATLEFGTYDRDSGLRAFIGDHWLHAYGDPRGPEAGPIKAAIRRQFYPDTDDWKEAVLFRGDQAIRMAIAGLGKA